MIATKFHENRLTIDREINEKHAILVDHFQYDFGYDDLSSILDEATMS